MKEQILLIMIMIAVLLGCNSEDSILNPVMDSEVEALNKKPLLPHFDNRDEKDIEPMNKYRKVLKKFAKNYTINGDEGGKISQTFKWFTFGMPLTLDATLNIPKGAFKGELTFEIEFDPNELSMEFRPTPQDFDIPVVLDLKFLNVPKKFEIDAENLDFQYYDPDGTFESVNYESVKWLKEPRILMVKGAELHHFSRYGWVRNK
jgi:hypothetical protein